MKTLIVTICSMLMLAVSHAQEHGIINNAESPHVTLKSVNIGDCQWTSGFWADKFKLCGTWKTGVENGGQCAKIDAGRKTGVRKTGVRSVKRGSVCKN